MGEGLNKQSSPNAHLYARMQHIRRYMGLSAPASFDARGRGEINILSRLIKEAHIST